MAIRAAGVKLEIQGLAGYVSGISSAKRANDELRNSQRTLGGVPDPFAGLGQSATRAATQVRAAASNINQSLTRETTAGLANVGSTISQNLTRGVTEAEKRITLAARAESQIRVQSARAEAQERAQAARSGATLLTEGERRATTAARGEAQVRVQVARAEAAERAQAARAGAARSIEEERRVTAQIRAELSQRNAAQRASQGLGRLTTGAGGLLRGGIAAGVGFGLGTLGLQGASQLLGQATQLDELRGRANSAQTALVLLAGGSGQAASAIAQIQAVAPGATNSLQAAESAVTILAQKLPSAAVGFDEIARFAAIVPKISPSISDSADALGQLTLFASSNAFARADQLGVTAQDVKQRMAELSAEFPKLSDAQIKAASTVQLVNERFGPLGETLAQNVTGIQKLKNAFEELRISIAKGPIVGLFDAAFGGLAGGITDLQARFDATQTVNLRGRLQEQIVEAQAFAQTGVGKAANFVGVVDTSGQTAAAESLLKVQEQISRGFEAGIPGADVYLKQVNEIIQRTLLGIPITDTTIQQLRQIQQDYQLAAAGASQLAEAQAKQTAEQEKANASVAQQEQLQGLTDFGNEISRLTQTAFSLPAGLPGADQLIGQITGLREETALAGTTTEETGAKLAELNNRMAVLAVSAGAVVTSTGQIVDAEGRVLTTVDPATAAIIRQQAALYGGAQAAGTYAASLGAVAAAQAGISGSIITNIGSLVSGGTIGSGTANALNQALQGQLQARAGGLAGRSGASLQFAQAEIQRGILNPLQAGLAQIEREMTTEAQQQLSYGKATTSEAEKRLEAEQDALRKAVEATPGLFGASPVTQEQLDLAKFGVPQNFADDFLRRLKAEVDQKTGELKDVFPDVDIGQAREALGRIGIQAAEDPRAVILQLEEAWSNSSLFAAKENLALINQDAVSANQRLTEQMEQGRKNIYELFGIVIDDATEAVSGGGGGGGGVDQAALQASIQAKQQEFIETFLAGLGITSPGSPDAQLASIVTGAGLGNNAGKGIPLTPDWQPVGPVDLNTGQSAPVTVPVEFGGATPAAGAEPTTATSGLTITPTIDLTGLDFAAINAQIVAGIGNAVVQLVLEDDLIDYAITNANLGTNIGKVTARLALGAGTISPEDYARANAEIATNIGRPVISIAVSTTAPDYATASAAIAAAIGQVVLPAPTMNFGGIDNVTARLAIAANIGTVVLDAPQLNTGLNYEIIRQVIVGGVGVMTLNPPLIDTLNMDYNAIREAIVDGIGTLVLNEPVFPSQLAAQAAAAAAGTPDAQNAEIVTGAGLAGEVAAEVSNLRIGVDAFQASANSLIIPQVLWEDYIPVFPQWQGEVIPRFPEWVPDVIEQFPGWYSLIDPFPTWEKLVPKPDWNAILRKPLIEFLNQFITNLPGFASGTSNVPVTGAYLVGERGPELVMLRGGSGVLPAHETAMIRSSALSGPVQQALTQPASISNVTVVNNWNLNVSSRESTGRISQDFSIMRAQAAP